MNIRFFIVTLFLALFLQTNAKTEACNLQKSNYSNFYTVDVEQVLCIARNSDKDITIFYTYADWCAPCRRELPNAIKLAKKNNADFYMILVDRESDTQLISNVTHTIDSVFHGNIKAVIIADALLSERSQRRLNRPIVVDMRNLTAREKYSRFLREIATPQFRNVEDAMGLYIVVNNKGEVLFITESNRESELRTSEQIRERITRIIEADRRGRKTSHNF